MNRIRAALHRVPLSLAVLLAVAAVLSLSWSLATAPLQGPDETEHVAYVAHLAETGSIPSSTTGNQIYGLDEAGALDGLGYGRLLQNRTARPPWSPVDEQNFRNFEAQLPAGAPGAGDGPNSVAKNPPLYYAYQAIGWTLTPGGRFFGRLFVMRLLSGLLLLATVVFTWLLAGEISRRRLPQTVAAGVVALLPMAGFMSGIVNTDIGLTAIWACFLWLAVRTARLGLSWQRSALLALLTVASVLTHGRGLAIVPLLPLALVVAWARRRPSGRTTLLSAGVAAGVALVGLLAYKVVTAGAGGGLYGGEVNLGNSSAFSVRQFLSSIWQFYLPRLDSMQPHLGPAIGYRQVFIQQFLGGVFGSYEVYLPYWAYDLIQVAAMLLLVLLYTVLVVRFAAVRRRWPALVILAAAVVCLLGFLHLASYRALVNGSGDPLITGRYLLPLIPIVGTGAAAAFAGLPRRMEPIAAGVLLGGMSFLSLAGIAVTLERFYA